MKQKITLKKIAISITILAAVFVFASCSKQQPKPQDNQQGQSQQQVTDSYEGWQIYKNEKYGFEMRYPQDWVVKEIDYEGGKDPDIIYFAEKSCAEKYDDITECDYKASVSLYEKGEYIKEGKVSDKYKCEEEISPLNLDLKDIKVFSCRNYSLGAVLEGYSFSGNDNDFLLGVSNWEGERSTHNSGIERKILESFSLIE